MGLHPSGPHLHVRVEALPAPLLPVALSVEGQLVGARLHLAWQQEPRAAAVRVRVAGERKGGVPAEGAEELPAWVPRGCVPTGLRCPRSLTGTRVSGPGRLWSRTASRTWGSGAAQGHCALFEKSQKSRREKVPTIYPVSNNRFISGMCTFQIFSMCKYAHLQTLRTGCTSHTVL